MQNKKLISFMCLLLSVTMLSSALFIAFSSVSVAAAAPTKGAAGYVNDDYVNLRSGAGKNYKVLSCLRKNTKFTFVDGKLYNKDWYKIKLTSNSLTGYLSKEYASVTVVKPTTAAAATVKGTITEDYVNVRSGAGTKYSVVATLRKNTSVTFVSTTLYNKEWYNVKLSNGKKGYVRKDLIKKATTATTAVSGYVTANDVYLRSGAGTKYSILATMKKNTKFTFVSTKLYNTYWYNIKLSNGKKGYVHKDYVKKGNPPATSTQPATTKPVATQPPTTQPATTKPAASTTPPTTAPQTTAPQTSAVKLSNTSYTLYTGNVLGLKATGGSTYKWTSSNTSVATVNSSGVVTAVKSGSATIKATSGTSTASCKITVKNGSSVNISHTNISSLSLLKSVLLKSSTRGVTWKSSNPAVATVKNGVVDTKSTGYVTIFASTASGAASCLIKVTSRESIKFVYASPNSAPKNSNVTFKAITDTDRTGVYFTVSNGTTTYKVNATSKVKDGNTYVWSGAQKLSAAGKWTVKAYAKFKTSTTYNTTAGNGEGEVFVTQSTDTTTTVCAERRASDEVINLIANYEGFLTSVTADSITSDPTVGYGKVVLSGEQFYNNLTKNEAFAYLCQTVNKGGYTSRTNSFLINNKVKFNQQQFDALVCFTYNVGASAIYNDSDLQAVLLNSGSSSNVKAGAGGYVNASDVNLRSGAGTNYSVLTCMPLNTKFTFVDGKLYNGDWYKIKLTNGTVGYIKNSYASVTGGVRDLNYTNKQEYLDNFLAYHHAAGSCYWGLLYRRIDEAEVFFYAEYNRDGQYNRHKFSYTCHSNSSMSIR